MMALALECGLVLSDFEVLTIGMIFDYIDDYIEMKNGDEKEGVREATQGDFDCF